ncbi:hypothetical protein D3C86_1583970 [compost metagenome]
MSQRFRPGQRGAFARREERRFAPDRHVVQAQFAFAVDLRHLDVHVDTERTAVELRRTNLDELLDGRLDRGLLEQDPELDELLGQLGGLLEVVRTLGHDFSPVSTPEAMVGAAPPPRQTDSARTVFPARHQSGCPLQRTRVPGNPQKIRDNTKTTSTGAGCVFRTAEYIVRLLDAGRIAMQIR